MSDDGPVIIIGLIFLVGVPVILLRAVAQGAKRAVQSHKDAKEEIRAACEHRALDLIDEFPDLNDAEIGQLLNDEMVNQRRTGEWLRWANAETVGRIRRTVTVAAIRRRR